MKKFLSLFLALSFLFSSVVSISAEGNASNRGKVEIKFKVGDSVLKVNGIDLTVETPYISGNGTTLVPVRVITESFGAEVAWDSETKGITIKYKEVELKMQIGSTKVYTNGTEAELSVAPELTNSVTMVPLRFITESFGADVLYDETTKEITVMKELTLSNSIVDYSLILKRSQKERIGDSYYNWSLERHSDMKLASRSFDGRDNHFIMDNRQIAIYIGIYNKRIDDTIDTLLEDLKDSASSNTAIYAGKIKNNDDNEIAKVQFKDSQMYYDFRYIIADSKVFCIEAFVNAEKGNKGFIETCKILDTFSLKFDTEKVEDLSDIDKKTNTRSFESKSMGLSFKLPADFVDSYHNTIYDNKFLFEREHTDENQIIDSIEISIYSNTDEMNYEKMAKYDNEIDKFHYNPNFVEISEIQKTSVDGREAYFYTFNKNYKNHIQSMKNVFVNAGNYLYNICVHSSVGEKEIDEIINSIKIEDINAEEVGTFMRTDMTNLFQDKFFKLLNGISLTAPYDMEEFSESDVSTLLSKDVGLMFNAVNLGDANDTESNGTTVRMLANTVFEKTKLNKNLLTISNNVLKSGNLGKTSYMFECTMAKDELEIAIQYYVVVSNTDKLYMIQLAYSSLFDGEYIKNAKASILGSIRFE